ncbi:MAG: hypothetical protein ACOC1W_03585 [Bacillota bacterium]
MHLNLTSGENAKKYFEMGAAVAGGMDKLRDRPLISALVCPQSPYEIHGESAQVIIESAKAGIPINGNGWSHLPDYPCRDSSRS